MKNKIVVIGSINYDMFFNIDHFPVIGENILADKVSIAAGGKGANQAVQCAKLGLETYMAGCIGNDSAGAFLSESLENYCVRTDYLKKIDGVSGMAAVNALPGGKVFASIAGGANYKITESDVDAVIPVMTAGCIVLLQLEIPIPVVCYAIKRAKEKGCTVILNAAPAAVLPRDVISMTNIFIVNEVEAGFYTGVPIDTVDTAKIQAKIMTQRYGCKIIFTLGKDGAVVSEGEKTGWIHPLDVPAIETTGAGDSFIGGVLYGLINGKNIFDSAIFATYCSSITISGIGAQPSMPTLGQMENLKKTMQVKVDMFYD
jgi:ribokinase